MTRIVRDRRLIYDIGMSEGNDTSFYLRKGFRVVGVEADPVMHEHLFQRFAPEISDGRLNLLNRAASNRAGDEVVFFRDLREQGHSSIVCRGDKNDLEIEKFNVLTTNYEELTYLFGVPYYLKIDIEGGEPAFLTGMLNARGLPEYISSEIQSVEPIILFHKMGYKWFRLINQVKIYQFPAPNPPLEGEFVNDLPRHQWSGLFGRELPGATWFTIEQITEIHRMLHELWTYETVTTGWIDCHAWMPDG